MNAVTNFLNSNLDKPIDIFSDIKTMQDYENISNLGTYV